MTPLEELRRTGRLGPAGARALYVTVARVAAARRFPPPEGSDGWDESAVQSAAHDFLTGKRGLARLTELAIKATDEDSFQRLLDAAVLNHLRDTGRRTDLGRLIVRMKSVLRGDDAFCPIAGLPDYWALAGGPQTVTDRSVDDLAAAVAQVPITVPKWSSDTRHAPVADRESLTAVVTQALSVADGAVSVRDLARVVASRVPTAHASLTVVLDLEEVADQYPVPGPGSASAQDAAELFAVLSERERIVIAHADLPIRDLAGRLGVGKSQAATIRSATMARLRAAFSQGRDAEDAAETLFDLCENWLQAWTDGPSATSHTDVQSDEDQQ